MTEAGLHALGAWAHLPFFQTAWPALAAKLAEDPRVVLPPAPQMFRALERVQPDEARVVILGQDPYPTPGHAHGLAFSAAAGVRPLPRSLGNIFKEMQADIGAHPRSADLGFWADQGVLLLNTVLTVPAGEAKGHDGLGWQALTQQVLDRLADGPRAYLLWGANAQKAAAGIDPAVNLKIETAHPSPLSARRGFFGSRPFSRTNAWLQARGQRAINWANPPETP
ncbi:uracil-DNA glycosylase [Roseobacter sinensis]|uniref:Uracil-DNA glycosylase n=1 Tax=Roseobacter sinensis TaxID=2931391 RepID=A0ABT3BFR2_9RHOB|nr:uracil-DNA glycosylase [Roseobacter sp. WL0113]MCV3272390.1 uracil-DNA glycosylase [Roseobacter sp. WL0113]